MGADTTHHHLGFHLGTVCQADSRRFASFHQNLDYTFFGKKFPPVFYHNLLGGMGQTMGPPTNKTGGSGRSHDNGQHRPTRALNMPGSSPPGVTPSQKTAFYFIALKKFVAYLHKRFVNPIRINAVPGAFLSDLL